MKNELKRHLITIFNTMTLIGIVTLVFLATRLLYQTKELGLQNNDLSEKILALSRQNEGLVKQNKELAQDNKDYTKCIANVFAQYTVDNRPVQIKDIDTCSVKRLEASVPTEAGVVPTAQTESQPMVTDEPDPADPPEEPEMPDTPNSPENPEEPEPPQPSVVETVMEFVRRLVPKRP